MVIRATQMESLVRSRLDKVIEENADLEPVVHCLIGFHVDISEEHLDKTPTQIVSDRWKDAQTAYEQMVLHNIEWC